MMKGNLIIILIAISFRCVCTQVQVPSVKCPEYFEYVNFDSRYFGKLTLPNAAPGTTALYIEMSQRENIVQPNYYGNLGLLEDKQTTIDKLYRRQPILYRVDFPTPNVLPKLILIKVNGATICSDTGYPPPGVIIRLMHTITSSDLGGSLVPYQTEDLGLKFIVQKPQTRVQSTPPQNNFLQKIPSNRFEQQNVKKNVVNNAECGLENRVITPYIVGGQQLSPRQFPWLAAIYTSVGNNLKFICGGTLVSSRTIVTAAHCFPNAANGIVVHLGHYDLQDYTEQFETRNVQQMIKHPEFRSVSLPDADIAVLHLQTAVSFSESIRPACLWSEQIDVDMIAGQTAAVAGWGEDEQRQVQSKPKKANANIAPSVECQSALSQNLISKTARALCVRNSDGSTACRGDSGGGLVVFRNGHWILRGIVSGGHSNDRGCLFDYTFFCDLAQHQTWLLKNII